MIPEQNGRHFADGNFKIIFLTEKFGILIEISMEFLRPGPVDYKSTLVQLMAWRLTCAKPLPMLTQVTYHHISLAVAPDGPNMSRPYKSIPIKQCYTRTRVLTASIIVPKRYNRHPLVFSQCYNETTQGSTLSFKANGHLVATAHHMSSVMY